MFHTSSRSRGRTQAIRHRRGWHRWVAAWNGGGGWVPPAGSGRHAHLNGGPRQADLAPRAVVEGCRLRSDGVPERELPCLIEVESHPTDNGCARVIRRSAVQGLSDPLIFLDKSMGGGNLPRVWGVEAR
jgi:hypothetical protein